MKVTVKLLATLMRYLPAGAKHNSFELELAAGATAMDVIQQLGIPLEHCDVVTINGQVVPSNERASTALQDAAAVAIMPRIGGG